MVSVLDLNKKVSTMMEQSNYISNMLLPEKVKATRNQPLGPDCIVASKECLDQAVLRTVQYYWYISHEKGCVECVVKSKSNGKASTQDPKCVITRKNRRFEAYCCTLCRQNFVTVVQALLHLKAIHRPNNRILIQDNDVFENIDKAMEVPPVPLPWHIAKKVVGEQDRNGDIIDPGPTFVLPPVSLVKAASPNLLQQDIKRVSLPNAEQIVPSMSMSNSDGSVNEEIKTEKDATDSNPMLMIIMALTREFNRHIAALSFNDEQCEVDVTFLDKTKIVAKAPDLFVESTGNNNDATGELSFTTTQSVVVEGEEERVTVKANNPALARKLMKDAMSKGLAVSSNKTKSVSPLPSKSSPLHKVRMSSESDRESDQRSPLHSRSERKGKMSGGRQAKSVRFMLGAPDSSDDETTEGVSKPQTDIAENKEKPKASIKLDNPPRNGSFDGLQNVVDDLITTASKGRILPVLPSSPHPNPTSTVASIPVRSFVTPVSLHLVGSSPALSNMTSSGGTLTRNQSWTPSAAGTAFSVASIRRPYTARGFTYAEKIELMKQQNDYDEEFITKHIRNSAASTSTKDSQVTKSASLSNIKKRVAEGIKKHRRGRRPGRRPKGDSIGSSSDSDPQFLDHSSSDELLQRLGRRKKSRHASSDSDDTPPSLVANANNPLSGFQDLIHSRLMSEMFPTSQSSHSEYYGSGEWATAAMETLKNLQTSIEESRQQVDEKKNSYNEMINKQESHLRASHSDGDESRVPLKVKLPTQPARKRHKERETEASEAKTENSEAENSKRLKISSPPTTDNDTTDRKQLVASGNSKEYPQLPRHKYFQKNATRSSSVEKGKHGVSPLLNASEQGLVAVSGATGTATVTPTSSSSFKKGLTQQLIKKNKVINMMGSKCSSDPALSSSAAKQTLMHENESMTLPRISEESTTSVDVERDQTSASTPSSEESMIARAGDHLVFAKDFPPNLDSHENPLMMKYQRGSQNEIAKSDASVPEVFRNCVDTYFKVQLIQKLHVCKVCGFSVPADNTPTPSGGSAPGERALRAHVMEHSLKELYETGYEIGPL